MLLGVDVSARISALMCGSRGAASFLSLAHHGEPAAQHGVRGDEANRNQKLETPPQPLFLIQQHSRIFSRNMQQLQGRLSRLANALLPTLHRVGAHIEQARQ